MSIHRNIAASAVGNAWTALVQIAFVPVYLALLGAEAFGLLGVYAVILAASAMLDLGMSPTLGREVARVLAREDPTDGVRRLLRSAEWLFLALALALLAGLAWAAPWLAREWLRLESLPEASAVRALQLMALLMGMRLLMGLYRGVASGAQRLAWLAGTGAAFATARAVGVIAVLAAISPTIEAFFLFMAGLTAAELFAMRRKAWSLLPGHSRPTFSARSLRAVGGFTGGLALLSFLYMVLSQADKAILSAALPLGDFGYYALAAAVAAALNMLYAPIGAAAFPRLNELVARAEERPLADAFHHLAQLVTLAVVPAAAVLALFPAEILLLWTRDEATARVAPVMALLAVGTMLNAFMALPYMVPLAHGRSGAVLAVNIAIAVVFLPAMYLGVAAIGSIAAGYAWVAIHAVGLACAVPMIRRYLGRGEASRWLVRDVAAPAAAAFAAAGLVRALAGGLAEGPGWTLALLVFAALASAAAAAMVASPLGRRWAGQARARLAGPISSRA